MADLIVSEDKEKSLYLIQIQFLDEQLERCQLQCDELVQQRKALTSLYRALEKDRKDITEYLKLCVAAEEKKVEELAERLESQQQAARRDREALKLQNNRQLKKIQDGVDELDSETATLAATIEELQLVVDKLMEQQSDIESLKRQLDHMEEESRAAIYILKCEAESEREKMSEKRWWSTGDDYVETKTSGIVQEERAQHSQLEEEVRVLVGDKVGQLKEADDLQHQAEVLHIRMDITKTAVDKVTLKSCTHKKELEQLMKKCQQLKVELKDCSTAHESVLVENQDLRQCLPSASEESRQRTAEAHQLRAELQEESSRRRRLEGVMQEAVITLSRVLTDSEKTSKTQRKMLMKVLEILDTTVAPPAPGSTPEEGGRGQKPQTSDPKPQARPQTLNLNLDLATQPLFLMARYRPGDLGLVPRPTWRHKPATSRTRGRSAQPPLNRKLKTSSSDPEDPSSADCRTKSSQQ
ncbi:cilia- and flagella-associated protein 157-like isoform X1 [Sebastes umbrosus]|uniref:cilia- and flagella-associated protein 157-like isoform X1 n=1 Tax=Sebastes umbrosus TaxID=72105 RepID=UPI00189D3C11|nr:cilia- and flagella-associated protein 157-like isoform X1 [Sebastes umbrosus]